MSAIKGFHKSRILSLERESTLFEGKLKILSSDEKLHFLIEFAVVSFKKSVSLYSFLPLIPADFTLRHLLSFH